MNLGDIARWVVAFGMFVICIAALLAPALRQRNAVSMGFSCLIGAILCLSHLAAGERGAVALMDGLMSALVALGCGGLWGHAIRQRLVSGGRLNLGTEERA